VSKGFEPGIWMGVTTSDEQMAKQHPDWFVPAKDGKLQKGPWIDYAIDASNPKAVDSVIRPIFKGFKDAGFTYVKIDALRHLLYDGYYHAAPGHFEQRNMTAESAYRAYVQAARDELGHDTFVLSCWGVLPEGVGVFDACRLGGDGYGPATMQQYNSWNGIVWRSDPDHCDILPGGIGKGTVGDSIVRPVLASMASSLLLVSDKPEVYEHDEYLEGMKRSSPVLFSVPGQLYDYDDRKSNTLINMKGHRQETGGPVGPIDADQFGEGCEFWLQEIDKPYERWNVLARFSWEKPVSDSKVSFSEFGLDPAKEYAVYEFWSKRFLGVFKYSFPVSAQEAKGVCVYAIRERLGRPQILSTSRHISQGAVDLVSVKWSPATKILSGKSKVIKNDPYSMTVLLNGYGKPTSVVVDCKSTEFTLKGDVLVLKVLPKATKTVAWSIGLS